MLHIARTVGGTVFTRRFVNRAVTFTLGFITSYAFTNPDLDRVWEVPPAFIQRDYAFLSFYEVEEKNREEFEKNIKCLTRYLQTQEGYGNTQLVRIDKKENGGPLDKYQYVGVQTWFSPDLMKKAVSLSFSQRMISKLPLMSPFKSIMYKIVVDDRDFVHNG
ncbi:uncharacterized protein BBOV_IV001470 [Babesia bovis T2Bo]|uniref:Uncharacterized protein n=1 Tax=Babesia bovis TaxID=5865 RepID=A7AVB8_BABBO|nr:uncharacterized protein BBOV_IV001470 [Babesia bovis T2Bo]EDO05744.1 hypothetical protein BBOV_IV001470 [Babesia bovis T2Bo]|eukprot:XP_001609312.1 hypothetical protein [Babesia bovis T2Bo]